MKDYLPDILGADAEIKRLQERVTTLEDPTRGEVADGMRVDGQTSQEDARLKKENGDLWDRVSALTTDHASEIEESSKHRAEEIARIRRENDGRERTLEEEISRVLAELSETRQRNQGLEARGNAIEHENIRLGTENARLTRANAAGQGEFNSLREQSYHVSTELDSTRAELDSTRAELDVTRSTLYASQRENHDLRSGAGSGDFVKELLEKSNNPEALKKVITGMISDKEAASRAREALSTEVAELNEKLSQALAMNGEMAVKIGTLNSALNSTAPPTPRIEGGADADSISDKGSVAKHK